MFFAIPHLYGAVTAKHPLHSRAFGSLFLGYLRGLLVSVFDGCSWEISKKPGCIPRTYLVFSVFGQCCESESLKILSAKIGPVPVSCVAASLAFPASSALGHEKQESAKKALLHLQQNEWGLAFMPCRGVV